MNLTQVIFSEYLYAVGLAYENPQMRDDKFSDTFTLGVEYAKK